MPAAAPSLAAGPAGTASTTPSAPIAPPPMALSSESSAPSAPDVSHTRQPPAAAPSNPAPAAPGCKDGALEAIQARRRPGHTDPAVQPRVAGTAPQKHVPAVADPKPAAGERAGRAAEPGLGLEQGAADARLAERDRSG